jgi:glycerol-3-phosphate O-acyltransferase
VRRRYREPLYHAVLARYVQLITRNGVTQGIFLEGGLTRDGLFREPKIGLLDYLLQAKRDPQFTRPLTIVPVAINYDRVLEDRSLMREQLPHSQQLGRAEQAAEVGRYVVKVCLRFLTRRARRYGRACVNFGAPLSVDAWLASRPGALTLPRPERLAQVADLAHEVMDRIGAIMPVTAVALACTALLQNEGEHITRVRWVSLIDDVRFVLKAAEAHVVGGEDRDSEEILDRALVMLTLRHVVWPEGDGFRVDQGEQRLVRFYANSVAHLLETR